LLWQRGLRGRFPDKLTLEQFQDIIREYRILFPGEEHFTSGQANSIGPGETFKREYGIEDVELAISVGGSPISIPIQVTAGLGVTICNRSNLLAVDPAAAIVEIEGVRPYLKALFFRENNPDDLTRDFIAILQSKLDMLSQSD
jgi:hypothetical protein